MEVLVVINMLGSWLYVKKKKVMENKNVHISCVPVFPICTIKGHVSTGCVAAHEIDESYVSALLHLWTYVHKNKYAKSQVCLQNTLTTIHTYEKELILLYIHTPHEDTNPNTVYTRYKYTQNHPRNTHSHCYKDYGVSAVHTLDVRCISWISLLWSRREGYLNWWLCGSKEQWQSELCDHS